MEIFNKIIKEAERANKEDQLPDILLGQIRDICINQVSSKRKDILEDLLERLKNYEPFADVGCGNESYSTADVKRVVSLITGN